MSEFLTTGEQGLNLGKAEYASFEELGLSQFAEEPEEEEIKDPTIDRLINLGFAQFDAERIKAMSVYDDKFTGIANALDLLMRPPLQTKNEMKNDPSYLFLKGLTAFFHQKEI